MARNSAGTGRWFATQMLVSIAAAVAVAALFPTGQGPAPAVVETGKSAQRVPDAAVSSTVLRYDPQEQAALASMASFRPTVATWSTPPATPAVVARTAAPKTPTVLPPPRPMIEVKAAPVAPAASADAPAHPNKTENWRVVGMEIPGSATVRRYVPSGDDLLKTGGAAWSASTSVVRKVATLGGLL